MKTVTFTPLKALLLALVTSAWSLPLMAHEPIAKCELLAADTIRCKGGYGHGEDAPGVVLDVIDYDNNVLIAGRLGADSTFTFTRPNRDFYVLFDVGPGHQVVIEQEEIFTR